MRGWRPRALALAACILSASAGVQAQSGACAVSSAPLAYVLRTTPPLLADTGDGATIVELRRDGCVRVHLPSMRRDAGTWSRQLDGPGRDAALRRLDATGVSAVDPDALRARVAQSRVAEPRVGGERFEVGVRDEDIVELWIGDPTSAAGSRPIVWSTLLQDLGNHPGDAALRALADAVQQLRDLGAEAAPAPESTDAR